MGFSRSERGRFGKGPLAGAIALITAAAIAAIACSSSDSSAPIPCTSAADGELVLGSPQTVAATVSTTSEGAHVHIEAYGALFIDKRSIKTDSGTTSHVTFGGAFGRSQSLQLMEVLFSRVTSTVRRCGRSCTARRIKTSVLRMAQCCLTSLQKVPQLRLWRTFWTPRRRSRHRVARVATPRRSTRIQVTSVTPQKRSSALAAKRDARSPLGFATSASRAAVHPRARSMVCASLSASFSARSSRSPARSHA